jgi:aspartate/methionine/tyrosine aminotransferase
MLEVCSTTLPQYVIPEIYETEEFKKSLIQRKQRYEKRAKYAKEFFSDCDLVHVVEPKGAFYLSVVFDFEKINLDYKVDLEEKLQKEVSKKLN